MKKLILIIAAVAISYATVSAQGCLPEGITFTTQEQIDSFQINYPGCIEIKGDVNITGDSIINLNGLDVLHTIGGSISVYNNPLLKSISGLGALTSVGGGISLGTLSWLSFPRGNPSLASLTGLAGLSSLSDLRIIGNDSLLDLTGLINVDSVSGSLFISGNSSLNNLNGLNGVTYIGGNLQIGHYTMYGPIGNSLLSNLNGLESLTEIGGDLIFRGCSLINLQGLNNLTTVGNDFSMQDNLITSLEGLDNLQTISGNLLIGPYPGTGGEEFVPRGNSSLTSLGGLQNIIYIGHDIVINDNQSLSICAVKSICDYLATPSGSVAIQNNASGCNNEQEVKADCELGIFTVDTQRSGVNCYPNPFTIFTSFKYFLDKSVHVYLSIYDSYGRLIAEPVNALQPQGEQKIEWNAGNLPAGIYYCRLQAGSKVVTNKIVKIH